MAKSYSVLIIDMRHYQETGSKETIEGFPTLELAKEFARRRVRDSLEELRKPYQSADDLRSSWSMFGEDAIVLGEDRYAGSNELDSFIDNPALPDERDWRFIKRLAEIE